MLGPRIWAVLLGVLGSFPGVAGRKDMQRQLSLWQKEAGLAIAMALSRDLLFDDVGGFLENDTMIDAHLPGFTPFMRDKLLLRWRDPDLAWERGLPDSLKQKLSEVTEQKCRVHCARQGRGRDCCGVEKFCPNLVAQLLAAVSAATKRILIVQDKWESCAQKIRDSLWFFAQPSLLPYAMSASHAVQNVVEILVLTCAQAAASPTLRKCLSGSSSAMRLRETSWRTIEQWSDVLERQAKIFWELVATSRYSDARLSNFGHHIEKLEELLQGLANVLRSIAIPLEHLLAKGNWARTEGAQIWDASDAHGAYPEVEYARIQFFESYFMDKGVLRFLLQRVFSIGGGNTVTLAEFGALTGHYSAWLNDTGLVEAHAFDGSVGVLRPGVHVSHIQLAENVDLDRVFDWVLCLEVGEHMPKSAEDILLRNIARHARVGAIMSWATPEWPHPGHINAMSVANSTALIESHGFRQHPQLTANLREVAEVPWLKESIGVYYKE